ncbi:hypothetical protein FGG08_006067 [Glutinoglossum americanum]|uniref:S-adenosyl-L-methionine-dependent methyltransferase n=1 Tax=Glutinoglossum americanum TaxID=1670608 RepID=A0A9P8I481_9PEZI|nr:hypothetical protein FGG08_006067 [Glutinoglossum americanum]
MASSAAPAPGTEETMVGTMIIADDEQDGDGDSAIGSDNESNTTSLASSVLDYNFENGRRYHKFREGRYVFPNDDREQDREDLKHAMIMELVGGVLHFAPIGDSPQRVLDIGTGTGIWAIDMGEQYQSTEVIGTDLSPIQPKWVPPNVRFIVDDCESDWVYQPNHFDFIHGRHLAVAIRDWPKLLKQSFKHLKPGGHAEFQEILVFPESDDGTLPQQSTLRQYFRYVNEAFEKLSIDLRAPSNLSKMFRDAGFEDVHEKVYKIPLGTWPKNPVLKKVGLFQRTNFLEGLSAISLAPYTRVLGWSTEALEVWLTEVRKAILDEKTHSFDYMFFVYGRKPVEAAGG